ncbi:MAG: thiamine pyrophosphate-dependent enzyme, partial [Paracoccaceae bacterium]|nr:thiamine pyrophosphate-dependent enzyme [Paracoccaceae bacterium]
HFLEPTTRHRRPPGPDARELAQAVALIRAAKKPLIVAGGGVLYSGAGTALAAFAETHDILVAETQAGRSALSWRHPMNYGSIGVTGGGAANALAAEADLVIGIGTRFQDFTTGSWGLFRNPDRRILSINVTGYDSAKKAAVPLVADALVALTALTAALQGHRAPAPDAHLRSDWLAAIDAATAPPPPGTLPTDAHVIGAVQRGLDDDGVVLCAAGGLPGELQKLWKAATPNGYHMEYGYSCMGYEVAGGMGAAMALPGRDVVVMVGDGSWMMLNSELATSVMHGHKIIVVLLDNRGYACINRLQVECGGLMFNNLLDTTPNLVRPSQIDFVAHAAAQGAIAEKV